MKIPRLALILGLLFCASAMGAGYWQSDFSGSFKSILASQKLRQTQLFPKDFTVQTEHRLRLSASFAREWFYLEVADEVSLRLQRENESVIPLPDTTSTPALNPTAFLVDDPDVKVLNRLDRAFVQLSGEDIDVILGKQVIPMGKGHIFSAVSQVPRHSFLLLDPEYSNTEDAATVILRAGFTWEARFIPKTREQRAHNFHVRAKKYILHHDVAFTVGYSDDKPFLAMETAGDLGEAVLRTEGVLYRYDDGMVMQGLVGIDYGLTPSLRTTVEAFYNGFGTPDPEDYALADFPHRSAPYRGTYYAGTSLNWKPDPDFSAGLDVVVNLADPSGLVHVSAKYSFNPNVELVAGHYHNVASRENSEFGGRLTGPFGVSLGFPDATYLSLRVYF